MNPSNKNLNSATKIIGDSVHKPVLNTIDQDFLKRSHVPFADARV